MGLQIPNLDDRRFQDLVDEARRLIPRYNPRWTDHNLSDPGITLLELFASLVETMIYRLNRVPDKSYITFMDLMGVSLDPPTAARVGLTFWLSGSLSAPDVAPVLIPANIEVATEQGSSGQPITFSTDEDRTIYPPAPLACLVSSDGAIFTPISDVLRADSQETYAVFRLARPGDSLNILLRNDLSGHILELTFNGPVQGYGVNPTDPPLAWEAWCDSEWRRAEVERDETGGFNKEGQVLLHLPQGLSLRTIDTASGYLVRCRFSEPRPGQRSYSASPQIQTLRVATLGITVDATHSTLIAHEIVGRSSGEPGQIFQLERAPVLPRREAERVEVQINERWEQWAECANFAASRAKDEHYTLDSASGEIAFGPRIREPDGSERQYGAIPPTGSFIRLKAYRTGGGAEGNVGVGTLVVLKSGLPYVDRVLNRKAAVGGLDLETLDHARLRAPQMLRTRERAVTAEDYEYLALASQQGVRRARCLQPGAPNTPGRPPAGTVRLLLVPAIEPADRDITSERLGLSDKRALTEAVRAFLDERRLLATSLEIASPTYIEVSVQARLKLRRDADPATLSQEARLRLDRFLNPLIGGPEGAGWPFGRALYISEVYAILHGIPGIEYVEQVTIRQKGREGFQTMVSVPEDGLIVSQTHQIDVV